MITAEWVSDSMEAVDPQTNPTCMYKGNAMGYLSQSEKKIASLTRVHWFLFLSEVYHILCLKGLKVGEVTSCVTVATPFTSWGFLATNLIWTCPDSSSVVILIICLLYLQASATPILKRFSTPDSLR